MRKRTILAASAIVAVGCIAIPTGAYAANGGSWLLGRSNSESATTTVTNSSGTPLSLKAKSGYAPLAVNSSKTVTNLSADKVDGISSGSFARSTAKSGVVLHAGYDDYAGAKCPTGTIATGGGGYDIYGYELGYSGPDWDVTTGAIIPNSWLTLDVNWEPMVSFANCVNVMGGAVSGAVTNSSQFPAPAGALATSSQGPSLQSAEPEQTMPADMTAKRLKGQVDKSPK